VLFFLSFPCLLLVCTSLRCNSFLLSDGCEASVVISETRRSRNPFFSFPSHIFRPLIAQRPSARYKIYLKAVSQAFDNARLLLKSRFIKFIPTSSSSAPSYFTRDHLSLINTRSQANCVDPISSCSLSSEFLFRARAPCIRSSSKMWAGVELTILLLDSRVHPLG